MINKEELLNTTNEAFAELASEVDDLSDDYNVLFDPQGPPQVDRIRKGDKGRQFSFEEK